MITTGVAGGVWRAAVTPWGSVQPGDGSPALGWFVAADDRWHVPSREVATRQRRIAGTAVAETRVRVPGGDAVQRIYSVADAGGLTVIEVENDSTLPIAVAFAGRGGVLTDRPVTPIPVEGIELPSPAIVLPLGHRSTVRVAVPHRPQPASERLPASLPDAEQVVRGWTAVTSRASRLELPAGHGSSLAEAVTAARCELCLAGIPDPGDDPAHFLVVVDQRQRMGEPVAALLDDVADIAHAVSALARVPGWTAAAALHAAMRVLLAAGERRAAADVEHIVRDRAGEPRPADAPDGPWCIAWTEAVLIDDGAVLPDGLRAEWVGRDFQVFGLPAGPRSRIDYAVRWHGPRPALLWDVAGEPLELTAPQLDPRWRSREPRGEALLRANP